MMWPERERKMRYLTCARLMLRTARRRPESGGFRQWHFSGVQHTGGLRLMDEILHHFEVLLFLGSNRPGTPGSPRS